MGLQIVMNGDTYYVVYGGETLRNFSRIGSARVYIKLLYNSFCEAMNRIDEMNEVIYERPLTADELDEYERMVIRYERNRRYFEHDC